MAIIKVIFMVAISVALAITLTMKHLRRVDIDKSTTNIASATPPKDLYEDINIEMPFKRVSRFLAEEKNPRAADHCRKDNDICLLDGTNSTCCNNKCMDLSTDEKNCGACKKKCLYTETCCRGDCVDIAYDKRHCGECNHACMPGGYCIYGLCDYA